MSNKEKVIKFLDNMPEYKIAFVLAYIQGLNAENDFDDEFCEALYRDYLNDDDPEKDMEYSLEDCKKEWGLG